MKDNYFFVKYRTKEGSLEFGQIAGQIIEILPPKKDETKRGKKEGDWIGFTKIPQDKNLWDILMTGKATVDPQNTTFEHFKLSTTPDLSRIEAVNYIEFNAEEWKKSTYYQAPARKIAYKEYGNGKLVNDLIF